MTPEDNRANFLPMTLPTPWKRESFAAINKTGSSPMVGLAGAVLVGAGLLSLVGIWFEPLAWPTLALHFPLVDLARTVGLDPVPVVASAGLALLVAGIITIRGRTAAGWIGAALGLVHSGIYVLAYVPREAGLVGLGIFIVALVGLFRGSSDLG